MQRKTRLYRTPQIIAIAEALGATVVLGSTLVLVKLVLDDIGPLTITAVRYSLAFLLLIPLLVLRDGLGQYPSRLWMRFILLGISFYVVGNGALYIGLKFIPATTASLVLSFVPLLVMLGGVILLREIPAPMQFAGLASVLVGSVAFFSPVLRSGEPLGLAVIGIGLLGNAVFGVIGREVQQKQLTSTLSLTAVPMGVGSIILVPLALVIEGLPHAPISTWAIVFMLAGLNTAGVYILMNYALKVLAALALAVIVNLTPLLTAFWSRLLLNEKLQLVQVAGIVAVILGIFLVERSKPNMRVH